MTSSSDTFPFGIADVVELLGLSKPGIIPNAFPIKCSFFEKMGSHAGSVGLSSDSIAGDSP